jgi:hypothetical protein
MIAFDLALGTGALLAPDATLRALGHAPPSEDARHLFRRCGPIWLTFAAAHAVAAIRDRPEDWHALAWLRGTEIATDIVWSRSPAGCLLVRSSASGYAGTVSSGSASAVPAGYATRPMIFAGTPAAIEYGGMSFVTTELAPMTERRPIVTPLVTTTWAPHHTLSPIRVGPLLVNPCQVTGIVGSSKR